MTIESDVLFCGNAITARVTVKQPFVTDPDIYFQLRSM
jgi:hypothetical protein